MTDRKTLACRADAFTPQQRERYRDLRAALKHATTEISEHSDGYEFRFQGGTEVFLLAAEFVTLERRCCPFFDFTLYWASDSAPALKITGGEGAKAVMTELLVS